MDEKYEEPNQRPKPTPIMRKENIKEGSVEHLKMLIDEIKKTVVTINKRIDNIENNIDLEKKIHKLENDLKILRYHSR